LGVLINSFQFVWEKQKRIIKERRQNMKITELTEEQLIIVATHYPDWMVNYHPEWMAKNRPELMSNTRPDWMAKNRPDWMAIFYPEWMSNHRPEWDKVPEKIVELLIRHKAI
jgi:hypothetical protein